MDVSQCSRDEDTASAVVSRHLVDGKRKEKSRKLPTRTRLRGEAENVLAYNDAQRMGFLTTELVYLKS